LRRDTEGAREDEAGNNCGDTSFGKTRERIHFARVMTLL
jgi:hypothetical protein